MFIILNQNKTIVFEYFEIKGGVAQMVSALVCRAVADSHLLLHAVTALWQLLLGFIFACEPCASLLLAWAGDGSHFCNCQEWVAELLPCCLCVGDGAEATNWTN
jgi:hypothetical protein